MTPELCTGTVMHARFAARQSPTAHRFVYPLFFLALPLSQVQDAGNRWFGIERARPLSLRFRDHGARDGSPLLPWIRQLLATEGISAADGEVVLQTFPRMFGFVFNPVSFWFCHDRSGALRAVLAEVRNTFGDRHNYLIAHADQRPITAADTLTARKIFHVSPFFPVAGEYRFRFDLSDQRRRVELDYWLDGERVLATALEGRPQPLAATPLRNALLRQPLLTLAVVWRIHWQAVQLWWKRAVFHSRPQPPLQETTR
ncbi:MAG: DUF1365 domain-containing protein [Betaproteobacteria bacterium]|nr:DUF1365 domain-containing protein [Betaproteobacteria bacterium]